MVDLPADSAAAIHSITLPEGDADITLPAEIDFEYVQPLTLYKLMFSIVICKQKMIDYSVSIP